MSSNIYLGNNTFLSEEENILMNDNVTLTISEKEKRLLSYFIRHADEELPKRTIIENIWENRAATVDDANLTQLVYKIRRDLAAMNMKSCIKTIPGKGYVFLTPKTQTAVPLQVQPPVSRLKGVVFLALAVTAVVLLALLFSLLYR